MIRNNILKLLSVAIALVLWMIVVSSQSQSVTISIPLRLINVPKQYIAVPDVKSVTVTVKGAARLIQNIDSTSIILNIDVSSFPFGDSSRRILPIDIKVPIGLEVTEVIPNTVIITIDHVLSKHVKITPTFIGDPANGYRVEAVETNPKEVIIEGAKSKIVSIENIPTLPVNISNLEDDASFSIGLKIDEGIKSAKPESVEVKVKMRFDVIRKNIKSVPVSCEGLHTGFELKKRITLTSATIKGRRDLVENFTGEGRFSVDCSDIDKSGKYSRTVISEADLDGVEVLYINPAKINFEIISK